MKKIKLITLLMAAPMLWSCSAEDPMPPQTKTEAIEDPNFVPLDEALEICIALGGKVDVMTDSTTTI